jgi:hypothetical protein
MKGFLALLVPILCWSLNLVTTAELDLAAIGKLFKNICFIGNSQMYKITNII